MKTTHKFINSDSRDLSQIENNTIDLVVTSPPYPMIKMWDEVVLNKEHNKIALDKDYEEMSDILNSVWIEVNRVLKDGGVAIINMGDATRSNSNGFKMYSNASKVINSFLNLGFEQLPGIIWRKPTNSPNKFLGSGMYPVLSYVTLEHEHILIFRKGKNRVFSKEDMIKRRESAFFWEERNKWFSDLWNVVGTRQNLPSASRKRNAAFPIEIPFRLINMYSIKGDNILDPFCGTGTTSMAAAMLGRNSISVDLMNDFINISKKRLSNAKDELNKLIDKRIEEHKSFVKEDDIKYLNKDLNVKVKTNWETKIKFNKINDIKKVDKNNFEVNYLEK